jgi:hypothetical protein
MNRELHYILDNYVGMVRLTINGQSFDYTNFMGFGGMIYFYDTNLEIKHIFDAGQEFIGDSNELEFPQCNKFSGNIMKTDVILELFRTGAM